MLENKIQAEIVMWFSQEYPIFKGCLFSVDNSTYSDRHGASKKAMGCVAGVSDLVLYLHNRLFCLEIKSPDKKHQRSHIENQLEWAVNMESHGAEYYIITSLEEFKEFLKNIKDPKYGTAEIKVLLENQKSQIKFEI